MRQRWGRLAVVVIVGVAFVMMAGRGSPSGIPGRPFFHDPEAIAPLAGPSFRIGQPPPNGIAGPPDTRP